MTQAEPDVIDRTALNNLLETVNGDTAFLGEMIDEYFNNTPQLLVAIRQALATDDAVALRRSAHTLKSNSASFGAQRLAVLCKELEERGRASALDSTTALVAQIEAEYNQVRRALHAIRSMGYSQ